jgi:hypothetical protein
MTHLLRGCRFCLSKTKVVLIAMIVEVVTFIPTHALMAWLGLIE